MINELKGKIESFLAEDKDLEIVDVRLGASGGKKLVQVLLDKESGIGLDDLTEVNRRLSKALDKWEIIPGAYILEVSSAGLERPLTQIQHYSRFSGRKAKIQLFEPVGEKRRKITGIIRGVEGSTITIESDTEIFKLPFTNIKKANLVFEKGR